MIWWLPKRFKRANRVEVAKRICDVAGLHHTLIDQTEGECLGDQQNLIEHRQKDQDNMTKS